MLPCTSAAIRRTHQSLALVEYDGQAFHHVYLNQAYRDQLASFGRITALSAELRINRPGTRLYAHFRDLMEGLKQSGHLETLFQSEKGYYVQLTAELVASMPSCWMLTVSLHNLTLALGAILLSLATGNPAFDAWGSIAVGNTRRRLSFFVMVLAWSRQMYVEFTLGQTMEQFLACHVNAFRALGVPHRVMVDNLRCAVLHHPRGGPVQFNPRYLDFARHFGFQPVACAPAKGNEKGRVERGVAYVKSNFLNGLDLPDFAAPEQSAPVIAGLASTTRSIISRRPPS